MSLIKVREADAGPIVMTHDQAHKKLKEDEAAPLCVHDKTDLVPPARGW
jgi:hypothetical protein